MGIEEIVPAIALVAVLVLVLPSFLKSNSEKKQFFKNLSIWSLIIISIMIISYFILR